VKDKLDMREKQSNMYKYRKW